MNELTDEQIDAIAREHFLKGMEDKEGNWGPNTLNQQWCEDIGRPFARALLSHLQARPLPVGEVTDEHLESLIEASDGHWKEDVFCIGGPELMALLRAAASPIRHMSADEFLRDALADLPHDSQVSARIRSHLAASPEKESALPVGEGPSYNELAAVIRTAAAAGFPRADIAAMAERLAAASPSLHTVQGKGEGNV